MMFQGTALSVELLPSGVAKLQFDLKESSVNKFNRHTLGELSQAIVSLAKSDVKGLIFTSGKSGFIVGADITEFAGIFAGSEDSIEAWLIEANEVFNAIEDLPFPTVCAINGIALGGGFELAIATDYRVACAETVVGFPEVKLGIIPGFGGTVRLPRLIGADNANVWISSGSHIKAGQAFQEGALDAVVERDKLEAAAEDLVLQCSAGKLNFRVTRKAKNAPLSLGPIERNVAFETATALVIAQAGRNYPAPVAAVAAMQKAAGMHRADALQVEHKAFARLAVGEVAANLVQMFLNDQVLAGLTKKAAKVAKEVNSAAVLGAGIMGGGIAYQSASKGVPILMKDIRQEGIDLGMSEARKLLGKKVNRGKLSNDGMIKALSNIHPTMDYSGIDSVDFVVEAVVEKPAIKKSVLQELERLVCGDTIIATNTSTISVDELSNVLERPENFCGMHFFNPVPIMPLVEVIRGKASSVETIATTVAYAKKLGKTPIVVNNCPGFLVNRVLFPYFGAFAQLIHDGADFRQIDQAMERFGWPMGPAYLMDVVGIDTGYHAQGVMAAGFERMQHSFPSVIETLFEAGDLGQKAGKGFYLYTADKKGKPKKLPNPDVDKHIAKVQPEPRPFGDEEIVNRMMVAMCLETVRCLEDKIVGTAVEADMGLALGIGFPPFRGGALRYLDSLGVGEFVDLADSFSELGGLYQPTDQLRQLAKTGGSFYQ
ncbi:MAG TPA: fatty acid oxidation complex subunit alpha FadB [Gammaproteobacteria bacterium]|nr:fatty acid oxidation complex subunit alpha FadB [Gammaproteobacteria bacterium]